MEFVKTERYTFKIIFLFILGLGLLVFELMTPQLFLINKSSINVEFQGHLQDHEEPLTFASNIQISQPRKFVLEIHSIQWEVGPSQFFFALTFNKTVPGPTLGAFEGETIEITLINKLTSFVSFDMMEPLNLNQFPRILENTTIIQANSTETLFFTIPENTNGTWIYRDTAYSVTADLTEIDPNNWREEGIIRGLYGAFVIYDQEEKLPDHDIVVFMDSFKPPITNEDDFFAVQNGKIYPYIPHLILKEREFIRFRIINVDFGGEDHTIHIHGQVWGNEVKRNVDNELLSPGEAIDRVIIARKPGLWMYHCHIYDHIAAGMTGMLSVIPADYPGDPLNYIKYLMDQTPLCGLPD